MTTIATHEIIISVRPERLAEVEPLLIRTTEQHTGRDSQSAE